MAATSNFTRGGQISMHRLRMFQQISMTALMIALVVGLTFFCAKSAVSINSYDWYLLKEYLWADLTVSMSPRNRGRVIQDFEYANGYRVKARSLDIVNNPHIKKRVSQVQATLYQTMLLSSLLSLIVLLIAIVYFVFRGRVQFKNKLKRGGAMVSVKQLAALLKSSDSASCLCLDDLPLVKDKETSHLLIMGSTGSGKSNCLYSLLPQIRKLGQKAVVVDLTGDLVARYYRKDQDLILNPFDERSLAWHPWAECKIASDYDSMADAFIGSNPNAYDPFWEMASKTVFASALKCLANKPSTSGLFEKLATVPLVELASFLEGTKAAALTDSKGEKTTLSIRASLVARVSVLEYLKDTQESFSIKQWIQKEQNDQWLFLTAMPPQRESLRPLLSTWMDTAIQGLMAMPPDYQRRVWFVIDELPALQKLPSLGKALAELRKYGGCILAGIQDIPQIKDIYGNNGAQTILNQCNTKVFFRSTDPETCRYISQALGEREQIETSENLSYGANTTRDGVSLSETKRVESIVLPTEVSQLQDLQCYIKLPGDLPITQLQMTFKKAEKEAEEEAGKKVEEEEKKVEEKADKKTEQEEGLKEEKTRN
ncbi:MAG: type IV conjugative transfer system coupling protein TraD [Pseudomonadota bacterium]